MKTYIATVELYIYAETDDEAVEAVEKIEKQLNRVQNVSEAEATKLEEKKQWGFFNRDLNIQRIKQKRISQNFKKEFKDYANG